MPQVLLRTTLVVVAPVVQRGSTLKEHSSLATTHSSKQMVVVADTAHTKVPHAAGAVVKVGEDESRFRAAQRLKATPHFVQSSTTAVV
jgi:hypothetical protein